jgi:hypothetical protein
MPDASPYYKVFHRVLPKEVSQTMPIIYVNDKRVQTYLAVPGTAIAAQTLVIFSNSPSTNTFYINHNCFKGR